MKKEIGNNTYTEMYLVTREDKNLLEKCINHLRENPKEKNTSNFNTTNEKTTQTQDIKLHNAQYPSFSDDEDNTVTSTKDPADVSTVIPETEHPPETSNIINNIRKVNKSKKFRKSTVKRLANGKKTKNDKADKFGLLPIAYSPVKKTRSKSNIISTNGKLNKTFNTYKIWGGKGIKENIEP